MLTAVACTLGALVALLMIALIRTRSAAHAEATARVATFELDGMALPVKTTYRRGWSPFSRLSHDSTRSFLSICEDGVRFRVFSESKWSFSEMDYLDVCEQPSETKIVFCINGGRLKFVATVADRQAAIRVMACLPSTFPLTERAAVLRDGPVNAAMPAEQRPCNVNSGY